MGPDRQGRQPLRDDLRQNRSRRRGEYPQCCGAYRFHVGLQLGPILQRADALQLGRSAQRSPDLLEDESAGGAVGGSARLLGGDGNGGAADVLDSRKGVFVHHLDRLDLWGHQLDDDHHHQPKVSAKDRS